MAKVLIIIGAFLLFSCPNQDQTSDNSQIDTDEIENVGNKNHSSDKQEVNQSGFEGKNGDWLNPDFLSADFNTDNVEDTAYAVIIGGKKGIRIKHGLKNEEFIIGAGNSFGNGGDDFYWVDFWNLVDDSSTYQTTFSDDGDVFGQEEIDLESTAFYIGNEEMGAATIAWLDGEYVWIHQAD